MEWICYLFFCVCSGAADYITSKKNRHQLVGNALEALFRGSVEEFLEDITGRVVPSLFRGKIRKSNKVMLQELFDYIDNLERSELNELIQFLNENLKTDVNAFEAEKIIEAIKGIRTLKEMSAIQGSKDYKYLEKELDKATKGAKKQLKAVIDLSKKVGKWQTEKISIKSTEECVEQIFNNPASAPKSVIRIIEIVNLYAFERIYITIGTENRDVTKVFQFMLVQNNTSIVKELFERLTAYFDVIIQQNGSIDFSRFKDSEGEINYASSLNKLAQKDPFCFARIECPVCHASGSQVKRSDTAAKCNRCGEQFEIIRNIEDFKDTVETVRNELIRSGRENTEELKKMAESIVSKEYMKTFERTMESSLDGGFDKIVDSQNKAISEINVSVRENGQYVADLCQRALQQSTEELKTHINQSAEAIIKEVEKDKLELMSSLGNNKAAINVLSGYIQEIKSNVSEFISKAESYGDVLKNGFIAKQMASDQISGLRKICLDPELNASEKVKGLTDCFNHYTSQLHNEHSVIENKIDELLHTHGVDDENCPRCGGSRTRVYECKVCHCKEKDPEKWSFEETDIVFKETTLIVKCSGEINLFSLRCKSVEKRERIKQVLFASTVTKIYCKENDEYKSIKEILPNVETVALEAAKNEDEKHYCILGENLFYGCKELVWHGLYFKECVKDIESSCFGKCGIDKSNHTEFLDKVFSKSVHTTLSQKSDNSEWRRE